MIFYLYILNTFFYLCILYWSITNLQCCDSFRWEAQGLSHAYPCIHSPQSPLRSRLPHKNEQSSLCYTVGPCCKHIVFNRILHILFECFVLNAFSKCIQSCNKTLNIFSQPYLSYRMVRLWVTLACRSQQGCSEAHQCVLCALLAFVWWEFLLVAFVKHGSYFWYFSLGLLNPWENLQST